MVLGHKRNFRSFYLFYLRPSLMVVEVSRVKFLVLITLPLLEVFFTEFHSDVIAEGLKTRHPSVNRHFFYKGLLVIHSEQVVQLAFQGLSLINEGNKRNARVEAIKKVSLENATFHFNYYEGYIFTSGTSEII